MSSSYFVEPFADARRRTPPASAHQGSGSEGSFYSIFQRIIKPLLTMTFSTAAASRTSLSQAKHSHKTKKELNSSIVQDLEVWAKTEPYG